MAKRVKQVGFDILVDENTDGFKLAEEIADFLQENGYEVLGGDFEADMTDIYVKHYRLDTE